MGTQHGMNDQYGATGAGHTGQAGIPPSAALNAKGANGGGHSTTGKIERGMGNLLGSESLRAKGVQKEQWVPCLSSCLHYSERLHSGKHKLSVSKAVSSPKLSVWNARL